MKRVILESPYRGHGETAGEIRSRTDWNVVYARACIRDCLFRGEAPIASHLLFTQPGVLRDEVANERALGIAAGLAWFPVAECSVYYTDHGWSSGMLSALHDYTLKLGYDFRIRSLTSDTPLLPTTLHEEIEALLRSKMESKL